MVAKKLLSWLPNLNPQIWLLTVSRLICHIGWGSTIFYTPIFLQLYLPNDLVGIILSSASVSGVFGRFQGGSLTDQWGRKPTILLAAAVSIFANLIFPLTTNFPFFLVANLLKGLGMGIYWPPIDAIIADFTTAKQRNEAFALTRLADNLGIGVGTILGGVWIEKWNDYGTLFIFESLTWGIFFLLIYLTIQETQVPQKETNPSGYKVWAVALKNRPLIMYILANTLLTTYIALQHSAIPLYFKNFLPFSEQTMGSLFTFNVFLGAILQLPIAHWLNPCPPKTALKLSFLFWGLGFVLLWGTGTSPTHSLTWAVLALGIMAIAVVIYIPAASTLIVNLSPPNLRGVYFSINSQCWAMGYFIAPLLGGWALDHPFWLASVASVGLGILILG